MYSKTYDLISVDSRIDSWFSHGAACACHVTLTEPISCASPNRLTVSRRKSPIFPVQFLTREVAARWAVRFLTPERHHDPHAARGETTPEKTEHLLKNIYTKK